MFKSILVRLDVYVHHVGRVIGPVPLLQIFGPSLDKLHVHVLFLRNPGYELIIDHGDLPGRRDVKCTSYVAGCGLEVAPVRNTGYQFARCALLEIRGPVVVFSGAVSMGMENSNVETQN